MSEKILIVDDEEDVRLLISKLLTSEGYTVVSAENGAEGFERFRHHAPDLVITDVKMPVRNGLEMLKDIKSTNTNVDVIVLTGHSDESIAIDCLRCGAYDYLLKPLEELDVLIASVQRALQKRSLEIKNNQLIRKLEEMVIRDPLTGLYNHRHLNKCMEEEIARSTRYHHKFVTLIADIDHFKIINDTHGHLFGDFVLKRLARLFEDNVRVADTIFRYGGEEFLIMFPETDEAMAVQVVERLMESIRIHPFSCDGHCTNITISIGAALFPDEAKDISQMIGLADRRLYRAKQSGRDRFDFDSISTTG
jgi:two-component system, cell cycle response regulator